MDFTVSWSDAKKGPLVSAVVRLVRYHSVAVGKLPVDIRMKVGECGTNIRVEFSYACLVWSGVRLWCVIDEIVCEEFLENVEVSHNLNLFGVSAHDSFCGFGQVGAPSVGNLLRIDGLLDCAGQMIQVGTEHVGLEYSACEFAYPKYFDQASRLQLFNMM
jgi:hypothetical protein